MPEEAKASNKSRKIEYNGLSIEYTVSKSKRKTIGIRITQEKKVAVTAPYRLGEEHIRDIVLKKAAWIIKTLQGMKAPECRKFDNGELFEYLGKKYALTINTGCRISKATAEIKDNEIFVSIPDDTAVSEIPGKVKGAMLEWYTAQAAKIAGERIGYFSAILKVKPEKVLIKAQKTLWGSCTRNNTININWRIIMAPADIVDYLIVHELAHIHVKNHSQKYWKLVESILPDCKERRRWLKQNGHTLNL